jgi:hypothetical protein
MRPWMIVAATMMAASTNASAQPDRTPPPGISSTPNLGCQARTGGLAVPPGEATGSTNLSDELSRSRGVICPPPEVDPGISAQPKGGGLTPVIPPPGSPGGDPRIIPK